MGQEIILIAEIITAIITIGGVLGSVWKLFKKINNFQETLNYNTLETLKLIIINKNIPLDERVLAGQTYIKLNGNGAIKRLVLELEEQLANQYVGENDEDPYE